MALFPCNVGGGGTEIALATGVTGNTQTYSIDLSAYANCDKLYFIGCITDGSNISSFNATNCSYEVLYNQNTDSTRMITLLITNISSNASLVMTRAVGTRYMIYNILSI